ncbi:Hypothetical predicted protein [Paramuricea clavata]|uniref:Uncharacterized protein n=1 Tax=Paramuricea clavata TaxID=317549 RepID=A0A6S7LSF8_PARCT|nr:Hypothetical predicted protein [Paramuricea clavata]
MGSKQKRSVKELNNSLTSTPIKPKSKQQKMENLNESEIVKIIGEMSEKLNKLDKLDLIETRLNSIDTDIKDLKHSLTYQQEVVAEVQSVQAVQENKLKVIEEKVGRIEEEKAKLAREIIDMRAHSMRSNLIFYNIREENTPNEKEEVENKIKSLLRDKELNSETEKIEIERAHRLGRNRNGTKPRPIVVKFLRFQDKEMIKRNAYKFKDIGVGISDQFPKEIQEERNKLYPVFKDARSKGHKAFLVKDKLFINGQIYGR